MLRIYIWNQTYLFTGSEGNFRTSLPILLLLNWNSKRLKLETSAVLKVIFILNKICFSLLYYYNVTSQSPCKCRQAQEAGSRKPPEKFLQFLSVKTNISCLFFFAFSFYVSLFSLGLGQNKSFGPKQNTKFGVVSTCTCCCATPTLNFLEGSRHSRRPRFGMWASYSPRN